MLEDRVIERIARDFPAAGQTSAADILGSYSGPETARVMWDILELSRGNLEKVRQFVQVAQTDYRDILYWAEYYENDPMLRGRDPKKMGEEILARWGEKKS